MNNLLKIAEQILNTSIERFRLSQTQFQMLKSKRIIANLIFAAKQTEATCRYRKNCLHKLLTKVVIYYNSLFGKK